MCRGLNEPACFALDAEKLIGLQENLPSPLLCGSEIQRSGGGQRLVSIGSISVSSDVRGVRMESINGDQTDFPGELRVPRFPPLNLGGTSVLVPVQMRGDCEKFHSFIFFFFFLVLFSYIPFQTQKLHKAQGLPAFRSQGSHGAGLWLHAEQRSKGLRVYVDVVLRFCCPKRLPAENIVKSVRSLLVSRTHRGRQNWVAERSRVLFGQISPPKMGHCLKPCVQRPWERDSRQKNKCD